MAATLAIFIANYRAAFLALAALCVGAAVPLAFAWARILPEDRPPFEIEPGPDQRERQTAPPFKNKKESRHRAVPTALLTGVTLGYAVEFPGFPREAVAARLNSLLSAQIAAWTVFGANTLLIIAASGAIGFAILNPGPLRFPFGTAAALVLILWLLAPLLRAALTAI